MFLSILFGLILACCSSASSVVLDFLPVESKVQLSRQLLSGLLSMVDPALVRDIPERFHSVVLGDFIRKKEDLIDTVIKRILSSRDIAGVLAEYNLRDVFSAFIAESNDKCMYWWLPRHYRDKYDSLIIQKRNINIQREIPAHDFRIPEEAEYLGHIKGRYLSCEPLVGHFITCWSLISEYLSFRESEVVDLSRGCGVTLKRYRSEEVNRFFPESRAVLTAYPKQKFMDVGHGEQRITVVISTLFMGEANPETWDNPGHLRRQELSVKEIDIDHIRTVQYVGLVDRRIQDYMNVRKQSGELKVLKVSEITGDGMINREALTLRDNIQAFITAPQGQEMDYEYNKVCVGSPTYGFSIFSYEKWLELPENERFVQCADLPRPNVFRMPKRRLGPYPRHERDRLIEFAGTFALIYEIPVPRLIISGNDCKVPAVDVQLFSILKERLDRVSDSDEFQTLVAEVWKRLPLSLLTGIPIDEFAKNLGLSLLEFIIEISDNNLLIAVPRAMLEGRGSLVKASDVKLTVDSVDLNRTARLGRILELFRDDNKSQGIDLDLLYRELFYADLKTFRDFQNMITPFLA